MDQSHPPPEDVKQDRGLGDAVLCGIALVLEMYGLQGESGPQALVSGGGLMERHRDTHLPRLFGPLCFLLFFIDARIHGSSHFLFCLDETELLPCEA